MKCPTLKELPPPPPDTRGWPWTEACSPDVDCSLDEEDWPRISIVTPSFNQGQFIEETIRSVLLQGYPNLEYVVIDGASTDQSAAIIRKYSPWLSHWVSEPDRGQSHAINKGLARCTGDIVAYINSDDTYLRNAFWKVARASRSYQDRDWFVGASYVIYDRNHPQKCDIPDFTDDLVAWYDRRCGLPQPSTFLRMGLFEENGLFDETLTHAFDHEYWIRLIISGSRPIVLRTALAAFKLHEAAKTSGGPANFRLDLFRIEEMHEERLPPATVARLRRSRTVRRWETEVRDGLQLCADNRWKEGSRLLFQNVLDRRSFRAVVTRPDIVARVGTASLRRLPGYLRDMTRRARIGRGSSQSIVRSEFNDPLGEYDLWDRPRPDPV